MTELATYLDKNFNYNPETGLIGRTDRKNSLGSLDKDGYLILKIKQKQYKSHRIAWLISYGDFPCGEIDHINRVRTDNRLCNLRDVDRAGNLSNTTKTVNKDTGVTGVHLDKKTKGLIAKYTIRHKGKTYRFRELNKAISFRKSKGVIV